MIAAEWKSCKLGDVVTLQRGFDLPKNKRKEGNIPIVSSSGVSGYHDAAKVAAPGVVTGRYGTLGEVFHVKQEFWPLNTTLYVRDFKGNDPLFVSYFLRTLNLAHQNTAGAVPGLNRNALHLLPVRMPPLITQRKIASVLSAYDDLIENNTRRIEILEEMAQRIYREWFVDFRFPGYEKVKMVDSELGPIPEGWERVGFHELLKSSLGGDWGKESLTVKETCPVAVIRGTDFGDVRYGNSLRVPTRYISETSLTKRRLHPGDIIVENSVNAKSRSVGSTRLITQELLNRISADTIAASFCKVFRPRDSEIASLMQLHLAYLYSEDRILFYQNVAANGIGNFQAKRFIESEYMSLPTDNQSRVQMARFFADLHKFASSLAHRIYVLRHTRDLLLPKLISGEMDVEDADIDAKADGRGSRRM